MAGIRVPLFDPVAAVTGVIGTFLLELAFLKSARLTRAWANSRAFRVGSLVLLVA